MLFNSASSKLLPETLNKYKNDLEHFINHLEHVSKKRDYSYNESSINLPFDNKMIEEAIKFGESNNFADTVIVIGVGGSNLGTQALYEALNYYTKKINYIFIDDVDANEFDAIFKQGLDSKKTIVFAVSKSGKTTEAIVNTEILLKKYPALKKNLYIITDKATKMENQSKDMKIKTFNLPEKVGGRFSVFSNVGLIPLSIGLDIDKLTKGAKQAVVDYLVQRDIEKNYASMSSISIFNAIQEGYNVLDFFVFDKRLERVGKWYRQLVAESLGKNGKGILPTVSVGSIDLHSVVQYYLGGPKHIFTNFLHVEKKFNEFDFKVGEETLYNYLVDNIKLRSASDIKSAIYRGVVESYKKANLPFTEFCLKEVNEFELGYLMQFKMIEVMILGYLLGVNTFIQPNVEEYKSETRDILKNEK